MIEHFIEELDIVKNNIETMESDALLNILDKIQLYQGNAIIEVTKRANSGILSDDQISRLNTIQLNYVTRVYDELEITKEQAAVGNKMIEKTIYDGNR